MATKIWARLDADKAVIEVLPPLPEDIVPGENIMIGLDGFVDVSDVTGIAAGWIPDDEHGFVPPAAPAGPSLDDVKAGLKGEVDAAAERARSRVVTPGTGQALEHQEVYAQAQAALAASGSVKASDYPMLAGTIGIDIDPDSGKPAKDVLGVAQAVVAARQAFTAGIAAIREARRKGKAAIEAAETEKEARAAFDAITWPKAG